MEKRYSGVMKRIYNGIKKASIWAGFLTTMNYLIYMGIYSGYVLFTNVEREFERYKRMPIRVETEYGVCSKKDVTTFKSKEQLLGEYAILVPIKGKNLNEWGKMWLNKVVSKPYECELPDGKKVLIKMYDVPPELVEKTIEAKLFLNYYLPNHKSN
ncbi:MAG: hypothetical protein GXN99_02195 [Candidatus Nanohaloarchaeota archaeon]|nr:hypothetical protein [Candidatus Nanohaloarchaeota archaeon]